MKLYIKEKVFTWADKFFVLDEEGYEKYIVEGEIFSFGKSSIFTTGAVPR